MKIKSVILSTFPLPYDGIGSWTEMYNYYLRSFDHHIDIVISPKPKEHPKEIKYVLVKEKRFARDRLSKYIQHFKYFSYWKALKDNLDEEAILIVQIIDNLGLLFAIDELAKNSGLREKIRILFFIHGYSYFLDQTQQNRFYGAMDELIVLTRQSYLYQMNHTSAIPCEVSLICNGIDSKRFYPITRVEKQRLKRELGWQRDKIYFLWISQDRPKKGLHIVLRAWDVLIDKYANVELLVIGTYREVRGKGIRWLGRIPNHELPQYYQAADFYLFPTLCHEGFGLSLAEALKCGSVCVASNIDPVEEVLGFGRYGRVVDFPHNPSSWVEAIEEEMTKYEENDCINPYLKNIPEDLYDLDEWCDNINKLVEKWKRYIELPK